MKHSLLRTLCLLAAMTVLVTGTASPVNGAGPFPVNGDPNALDYDGVNDYVEIPNTVNTPLSGNNITIEAWVKPVAAYNYSNLLIVGQRYAPGSIHAAMYFQGFAGSGTLNFGFFNGDWIQATTVIPCAGIWSHIVGTYDQSNLKIYVNGILVATQAASDALPVNSTDSWYIGGQWDGNPPASSYKGQIDEVRLWNIARTQAEIQANMNTELSGNESGLVAYYDFNQGTGGGDNTGLNTLYDKTANALDATVNNFALTGATSNWVTSGAFSGLYPEANMQGNGLSIADGDITPSNTDDTDFGSTAVSGGTVDHTFTLQNTGTADLNVGAITFSGANAADFSVQTAPSATVAAGGSGMFVIRFNPSASGLRAATFSLALSNECDENPYNFSIQGTGVNPEINITGNSVTIVDGDATPSLTDHTDFGDVLTSAGTVVRTFTIENTGLAPLNVSNITLSGANAGDFTIGGISLPAIVPASGSTTFTVTFDPSVSALRTATINVLNDDSNEATYDYAIQGTGKDQGAALDFDGTNDFTDLGVHTNLVPSSTNEITIEAWIYPTTNSQERVICSKYQDLNVANSGFFIVRRTDGTIYITGNGTNVLVTTVTAPLNTWTHVAVVFKSGTNNSKIYINGALNVVGTINFNASVTSTPVLSLGNFLNGGRTYWQGAIDEVRIWDDERTCDEISQLRNCELVGNETDLLAYYKFNHGIAAGSNIGVTNLDDGTANNYDGTLTNFALTGSTSNWITPGGVTTGNSCPALTSAEANIQGNSTSIVDGDATPSLTDHTDFGSQVICTGFVDRTFTLQNTGNALLNVGALTLSGTNAADFSVQTAPPSTVAAGGSATFVIRFDPSALGLRSAALSLVLPNECDENPYNFSIQGTGTDPEINLLGNAVSIVDGDVTPSLTDFTDFGDVLTVGGTLVRTYTIQNTGTATLNVSTITLTGTNASDFTIGGITLPATVAAAGNKTFTVTFDPSATALRSATINIVNDDCNEATYDYAIQGTGRDPGAGLDFDGVNDYVNVPNNASLEFGIGDFTLEMWIKKPNNTVCRAISKFINNGNGYQFDTDSKVAIFIRSGGVSLSASSTTNIDDNQWHHIAGVRTGNTVQLYVDGVLEGTATGGSSLNTDNGQPLQIGRFINNALYFGGKMDEVRIWNVARSCAEISQLRNCELTGTESGLVAYYKFNQGIASGNNSSTTTLTDLAGSPDNGTLTNFTLSGATSNWIAPGGVVTGTSCPAITNSEANIQGNSTSIVDGDATPSLTDHTDFGNQVVCTGFVDRTFTLQNTGNVVLNVGALTISGTNAADFSVQTAPPSTVAAGGSATFVIRFNPSALGLRSAALSLILPNECDENPYDFSIQGTGVDPEINVKGNNTSIVDGDATPSAADFTDFGSVIAGGTISRTFTVENTGTATLNISGVTITGASDFTVTTPPAATVAPGGSTTYTILFTASAPGLRSAVMHVNNDDCNEADYDIAIQGTGTCPTLKTFLGTINNDWTNAANWQYGCKPDPSGGGEFGDVTIAADCQLLNLSGGGNANFYGSFIINSGVTFTHNWSTGIQVIFRGGASKSYINNGTLVIGATGDPKYFNVGDGSTFTNNGTVTLAGGSFFYYLNGGIVTNNGTINGTGSIENGGSGVIFQNPAAGTISPGLPIGCLPTNAPFTNLGTLNFEVNGKTTACTSYDKLTVSQPATLGGTLNVAVNYPPAPCDRIVFFHATSISGTFATVNIPANWVLQYNAPTTGDISILYNIGPEADVKGNGISIADGDLTPSTADDTDFGNQSVCTGTVVKTYTIANTNAGTAPMNVSAISVSGGQSTDFTISGITLPASIPIGGSTTFTVTFNPSALGLRSTTLNITNDDCDENPYDFSIQGTGVDPEIDVKGNNVSIVDGDVTPSLTDFTDFGDALTAGGTVVRTFTIQNTGTATLNVATITLTGTNAGDFTVGGISLPTSVAAGGSTTFTVTFDPSATALRTATINIANDDCNEATYDFTIQGTGRDLGAALDLDGTDDYVNVPNAGNLQFGSEITLEAWINKRELGDERIVDKETVGGADGPFTFDNLSNLRIIIITSNGVFFTSAAGVSLNTWTHVAATYSASAGKLILYINGVAVSTVPASGTLLNNILPLRIGTPGSGSAGSGTYNGKIDEVRIWNVARSCEEINNARNCELTGTENGLVAYYQFNQGIAGGNNSGTTTVTDVAGGDNNGTLTNSALNGATSNWIAPGGVTTGVSCPALSGPEANVQGNSTSIVDGDATPSLSDHTDFGSQVVCSGTFDRTFTLQNTGTGTLNVGALTISGAHAADFSVQTAPPSTVAGGSSATFVIRFNPGALGLRSAALSLVLPNECDENPYDFSIQGTGVDPEIDVKGNNVSIVDGDVTPSSSDFTDFGTVALPGSPVTRTFTIQNTGTAGLNVTGITITGTNPGDFTFNPGSLSLPAVVPTAGSATFTVTFMPTTGGLRSATLNIANDDCNEAAYDFAIQGTADCPVDKVFLGTVNSDFNNPANWQYGCIADGLGSGEQGNVTIAANCSTFGAIFANYNYYGDFIINPGVTFNHNTPGQFLFRGGSSKTYRNDGAFVCTGGGYFHTVGNSVLVNNGLITVSNTFSYLNGIGAIVNNGTINGSNGGFDLNGNTFTNPAGGIIAPGTSSPGCFPFIGDFANLGTMNMDVNGTTVCSGYDQLTVSGTATLGGTLNVTVGYTAAPCDRVTIISASSLSGTFATINLPPNWIIQYNTPSAGKVSLLYNQAPEMDVTGNAVSITDGDSTPATGDDTDFGSTAVSGGTVSHTFTIQNTGDFNLNLTGTPKVVVGGTNAADFSVTVQPATPVSSSGGTTTFAVVFNPSAPGLRTANLSMANNDCDENPYNFSLQGTGIEPEMNVKGNNVSIVDGDATPSPADHTDFGLTNVNGGTIDRTFTIENTNLAGLNLTGTPKVVVTGAHATDFTVTVQPVSPVAPVTGTTTFTVQFNPAATGTRSATLSISNDDANENPYDFAIQGTGALSEIAISGNAQNISDGDVTPSVADHTDYGEAGIGGGFVTYTYTVTNTGNADLILSGTPKVALSGPGAAHFSVTVQPASPVVAISGTTTFTVKFEPTATGLQTATVSIDNDDSDENPFNFNISGFGTDPEMLLTGNGIEIVDGDNTPSLADHTDFGSTDINGSTIDRTYTIASTGILSLNLDGTPRVQISGANADEFSVTAFPSTPVATGTSTDFTVRFSPAAAGLRTAIITIPNDDATEMPYNFTVQGTGTGVAPDINLRGNGVSIVSGDLTPSLTDHTDFGGVSIGGTPVTRIFTVENLGTAALSLNGAPLVQVDGPNAADFVVTALPSSTVGTGGSTTFSVEFNPSAPGLRSATLTIANNDFYENPYTFDIQGSGLDQEMDVQGGSPLVSIADGDNTPSLTDNTDFGSQCVSAGTVAHTFTIANTGSSDLTLSGTPRVSLNGSNAADFTVSLQPGSPVAGSSSTTFTVIFNPSGPGLRTAALSIANNDLDENPYDFSIQGTGLEIAPVISGTATICNGASTNLAVNITGSGTGPYTVVYTDGSGNFTLNNYNSGANIPVSPSATKTYTLISVADVNGCAASAVSGAAVVTVNPIPDVIDPTDQTRCNGSSSGFTFSGSVAGTVFQWTNDNPSIGLAASGTGNIASFATINNGTTPVTAHLTVTPQYSFNAVTCTGATQNFTITINPTPNVLDPTDQTVCNGATTAAVNFTGGVSGTTFAWTNSAPAIGLSASGSGNIGSFVAINGGTTPITATITVTPSANGCPGPTQTFTITVNPTPSADFVLDQQWCNGTVTSVTTLSGPVSGSIFNWTNDHPAIGLAASGSGDLPFYAAVNAGSSPIVATITVSPSANGCTGPDQIFTITVNPTPNVVDPVDQTLCNGALTTAVLFSGAVSGTSYSWTNTLPSIGLAASGTGNIASFAAINNGTTPVTATLTVTPSANGCSGSVQTFTITVTPTSNVVDPVDQTLCNAANTAAVTFSSSVSGTIYNWTNNTPSLGLAASGTGDIASFVAVNTGTSPVTATITVIPSANSCSGPSQTFTITVNPTPDAVDPVDQMVCNGANTTAVTFSGPVSGTTYAWTNNTPSIGLAASGAGNIASFTAVNTGTSPVTATITVTPAANGCTGPAQTFTITINPTANVVNPVDQTVCNGASTAAVNFSGAVSGATYAWTNNTPSIGLAASGTGNIASFAAVNNGTSPVIATITVTPMANGCSGPPQTFTVTVNPTPSVNLVPDQQWCNAAATTVTTLSGPVSGSTFAWTNNNPAIGLAASGSGNLPSYTAVNSGTSPLTATITVMPTANGCSGPDQTFTITVNPTPNVVDPADQIVCNGAAATTVIFSSAVSGTSYAWVNNMPSIGLAASGTGNIAAFTAISNGTTPVTATITVTPTANGCPGPAQTFTITVNPTPNVVDPADQTLCNGATTTTVTFSGSVSGTTYAWVNNTPSIGLAANGSGDIASFTAINTGTSPVVATITVTPTANGCPGPVQTFTITVNPTPDVVDPVDQTVCNGANTTAVNFSGVVSGTTYSWTNNTPSIGLAASGTGNIAAFAAVNNGISPVTATITVTPSANSCPGSAQTFTITVNPTPNVVDPADQTLCNGANTAAVTFTGATSGTVFTWTNNTPSIGLAASGSGDIAAFTALNASASPVTATITVTPTANGCPGLAQTFHITVNPTPDVVDPVDQTLCNGASTEAVAFAGAVSGTTYSWTNDLPGIGLGASGTGDIASFAAVNNGTSPVTATITVTPSANGCPGPDQTLTITVNPTPTVVDPTDQTLCNGANTTGVNFTGSSGGATYTWVNSTPSIGLAATGTGNIASFAAINNGTTPVTATITVTPTANGCPGPAQAFTITVNPTPNVVDPVDQTVCNGANTAAVNFSGAVSGTSYAWTNNAPSIGLAASGTGNIASFAAVNNGTSPVTATITVTPSANGCSGSTQTFTITVNPTPNVVDPPDQTLCNGASTTAVTFSGAVGGTTYAWTNNKPSIGLPATGSGNIASFTAINAGFAPVTATITVTPSANGCAGPAQAFTITVNPTPSVDFVPNQQWCDGVVTTITNLSGPVSGSTFNWTNNNPAIGLAASGSGNLPAYTTANSGISPIVATITVTPTAGSCPGPAQTFTITVNPTPNVVHPADQTVCNGENTATVNFNGAVSGTTYAWVNNTPAIGLAANGLGNIAAFAAVNNGTIPVTATITVIPTANSCSGSSQSFTITVNPTPNVVDPTDQALCNGALTSVVSFTGSVSGTTFDWVNNTPSIGLTASGSGDISAFTAINTGTSPVVATITVTPTANGCTGPAQTFTITIYPTPGVTIPVADQTICNGALTTQIAFFSNVPGTTYSWTNDMPGIGLAASGSGDIAPFTAVNNAFTPVTATVTATPTSNNGCLGPPANASITVNPTPNVVDPADQTVCNGANTSAVSFTGSTSGTTFNWVNNTPSIGLAANGSGNIVSFTAINNGTAPLTATITVTPTANGCPGPVQTFAITVNPTPNVADPADQTVCNGANTTTVTFNGAVSGTTYAWTNDNATIGLGASGIGDIPAFAAINGNNVPVTAMIAVTPAANGCPGPSQTFVITVHPSPEVQDPADQTVCNGANTAAVIFSSPVSGTTYTWTNNTPSIGLAGNGTGNMASFVAINTGTAPVMATLTVTPTANGCAGPVQIFTITVNPTPNVVDPLDQTVCNGSGTAAVTFTGGVAGTTYNWINDQPGIGLAASGSGDINAFSGINNGTAPVTATITVTPVANGCTGPAETFTITINPTPDVAAPTNQTLCNGANTAAINFTGLAGGTTFAWTNNNPGIGLAASGTGNIASFAAVNNGPAPVTATITVTPTANSCAGPSQSFTITVHPTPNVAAPADQILCNGANTPSISFAGGVGGTTYSWINSNPGIGLAASGTGDIPSFTAINNGPAPATAMITITPSANGCDGPVQVFTITVNPTPNVVDPADQTVCNGAGTATVNFTGSVSSTAYSWTNTTPSIGLPASGTGSIPTFAAVNNTATPVIATITVMPTANGCTGPVQVFTITVNPTPNVADPADQVLCNGASTNTIAFSGATSGTVFNWTNDAPGIGLAASGNGDIAAFAALNNGAAPVTATITVTPTANGCPGPAQTFTITVNPTPNVADPADQTLCNGANTALVVFAGGVGGTTFAWTNTDPSVGLAASGSGDIPAFAAINNGLVPVTATISVTPAANGCSGPAQTFTITANPTPHVNDPSDQTLCNGESTNLVMFSGDVSGSTFTWTNDQPGIGLAASGTGNIGSFVVENTGTSVQVATITVTPTANGCAGPVQTFTITVEPTPVPTCPADIMQDVTLNQCSEVINSINATLDHTCGGAFLNYELAGATTGSGFDDASGTAFNIGETIVTYTATDAAGSINTCSFSVSIHDAQIPVITCPGAVVQSTGVNACSAVVNGIDPVSTDNCTSPALSFVVQGATSGSGNGTASGSTFNLGLSTVTYTATDPSMNTATCSFQVTVQDAVPPVVTCPSDVTMATDPGNCSAVALAIDPVSTDNCSVSAVSYSTTGATVLSGNGSASGSVFAAGISTITYTAVDASGNSGSCTFSLSVTDQQHPVPSCPTGVVQAAAPGQCSAVVDNITATFTDNCSTVAVTYTMTGATTGSGTGSASGSTFNNGVTTLVYAGADLSANTATCSLTITVTDDIAPTVNCPGDVSQATDPGQCHAVINSIGAAGADNCGTPILTYAFTGATNSSGTGDASGSTFEKGTTVVTYTATDASMHTATCNFNVAVTDNEPPALSCPADLTVPSEAAICGAVVNNIDATATDNCPNQVVGYSISGTTTGTGSNSASGTSFEAGSSTVTYTATDASGNTANCSFTVTVNDMTGPVINCPVVPAVSCSINNQPAYASATEFISAGGSISDNCGLNMASFALMSETSDNASCPETVTRIYSVVDVQGNISTCSQVLVVNDITAPVLTLLGNDPDVLCLQAPYVEAGATAIDDCGGDLSVNISITGSVDVNIPGTYVLTYTVTDACGNEAQKTRTITVSNAPDLQIASVTCSPDMSMYTVELNTTGASVAASAGTVTDNGGGSYSITAIPAGQNITVSVQDAAGCAANQNITAPNCSCGPISISVSDGDKMICAGSPVPTLSVSGYNNATETIDWYDAPSGGNLLLSGNNQYTPSGAGSYYAQTRAIANPNCISSVRVAVQLIIHAAPVADAGTDAVLCAGGSTTLSGSASAGNGQYSYSWDPATGLDDPSSQMPVASPASTGTYTLMVTDGNGCSATDQVLVTVNLPPVLTIAGTACAPDLLTFEVQLTSDAALITATAGAVIDNGGGNFTVSGIPNNTGLVITAQSAQGCIKTTTVNPVNCNCNVTAPTSAGDQEICEGTPIPALSVNVSNMATETADWYDAAMGGALLQAGSLSFTPLAAGTYWAETRSIASGACISSTRTGVTLTVHALPAVSITDPGVLCDNAAALTLAGTPSGGIFSGAGVTGSDFDPSVAQAGIHLITYEVTDLHGCSNSASLNLTVNTAPAAALDDPNDLCASATPVLLTGSPVGGVFAGNGVSAGQFDPATAGTGVHTLLYTVTANGCSNTATQMVEVWANPTLNAGADISACPPANIQLNAVAGGLGGFVYQWNNSGTLSDQTIANPVASPAGTESYSVTVTDSHGCSATDAVTVDVNGTISVDAGQDVAVCKGQTVPLQAQSSSIGNLTYSWEPALALDDPLAQNPVATPEATTAYSVTITDHTTGCSASDQVSVTVRTVDVQAVSSSPICNGEDLTLEDLGADGIAWTWSGPGGFSAAENSPVIPSAAVVAGDYTVLVTDVNGCTAMDTTTVAFANGAGASFESKFLVGHLACVGDTVRFIEISDTLAAGVAPTSFSWTFGDGGTSVERDPTHVYAAAGSYEVSVTVYNQSCPNFSVVKQLEILNCLQWNYGAERVHAELRPSLTSGAFKVIARLQEKSNISLRIYNSLGRLIETRNLDADDFFLEPFELDEPGVYFVKLYTGLGVQVKEMKVVVARP